MSFFTKFKKKLRNNFVPFYFYKVKLNVFNH